MAKVKAVITGALRKLGVVAGAGRRTATNTEYFDSLAIMLSMYRTLITAGAFGRMRDVVPRGDYVAGENQRVFRRYNEAQEILLPSMVSLCGSVGYCGDDTAPVSCAPLIPSCDYGMRPYGLHDLSDRRTIRDGSVVTLVDEFSGDILEAIYDGQRKVWITLTDLELDELDEANEWSVKRLTDALDLPAPLSHRDYNGLVCLLATLLADDFAVEIPAMVQMQAQQFKAALANNYSTYKRDDL